VLGDHRQNNGLVRFEVTNGGLLVGTHKRAVAGDIGCENSSQSAFKVPLGIWHPHNPTDAYAVGRRSSVQTSLLRKVPPLQKIALTPAHLPKSGGFCRPMRRIELLEFPQPILCPH